MDLPAIRRAATFAQRIRDVLADKGILDDRDLRRLDFPSEDDLGRAETRWRGESQHSTT